MKHLDDLPDLLTPAEAMRYLRVGKGVMYEMLKQNQIPNVRFGWQYRIPRDGLKKMLALQESE